ncbi:MAG: hypothetical protein SPL71_11950 [Oribacterium sp.]|nr:hypothetical protein [Oribacterium sp.]
METTQNTEMQIKYGGYKGFKAKFDFVMNKTASYFVEIGQMLKEARDTDILSGSGYAGMGEFAAKEYGLRPDQTSRFIAIAEKFGDGRGDLLPEYASHGYTKLSEMLTLPDAVAEAIPPEMTREDIRAIKEEVQKEQETTPLEVMMEGTPEEDELKAMLRAYFEARPEDAGRAKKETTRHDPDPGEDLRGYVLGALAPSGIGVLQSRPEGMGRVMLSFGGRDRLPLLTIVRRDECRDITWPTVWYAMCEVLKEMRIPEPEKEIPEPEKDEKLKIAPAQMNPPEEPKKKQPDQNGTTENPGAAAESESPLAESVEKSDVESITEDGGAAGTETEAQEEIPAVETPAAGQVEEASQERSYQSAEFQKEWTEIRKNALKIAEYAEKLEEIPTDTWRSDISLIDTDMAFLGMKIRGLLGKYKGPDVAEKNRPDEERK